MNKKIKIAILSSYTSNNIEKYLLQNLQLKNIDSEIKFGGYNQYNQELMDPNSWLNNWKPDIVIILLSATTFFKDLEFKYQIEKHDCLQEECYDKLQQLFAAIKSSNLESKLLLSNLDLPSYSPLGISDNSSKNSYLKLLKKCNEIIESHSNKESSITLFDFDKIASEIGKSNLTDNKLFYLGKIFLSNESASLISIQISTYINSIYGNNKKCLVVDLDNTLWGGIIGEDGVNGIKIGNTNIGDIYSDIQKIILNLKKNGILLAIASKNNQNDVQEVFDKNENMILKEDDFIVKKINWEPKSKNIMGIAQELNIGLNSLVFLDDNPTERLEVKTNVPDVTVIDFPNDIANLPQLLKSISDFETLSITEEDKKRHKLYVENQKRESLKSNTSLKQYLQMLDISISVTKNDIESVDRITQLLNKTNQFNLRTKRYNQSEVLGMIESDDFIVSSLKVKDKYGDLGLTGVIILKRTGHESFFIDSFLLSCRILSRDIETQFLKESINFISEEEVTLRAEYIKTKKNGLTENLYDKLGFDIIKNDTHAKKYAVDLKKYKINDIKWIKVM
ncbi:hypothetical protein BVX95_00635 [archaeon D22]|nr:hypothetical protein BVX95_00635 [archaeon D22]